MEYEIAYLSIGNKANNNNFLRFSPVEREMQFTTHQKLSLINLGQIHLAIL
jgi:hypothetical protein